MNFYTAKWTNVPLGCAKFQVNRFNESPLQGENADFQPESTFNTGSLPLCGNPVGNNITIIEKICGRNDHWPI